MKSRWFSLKETAINMRKKGSSIRDVEKTLKIPRSTLSGWFKNIELSKEQKDRLRNNWLNHFYKARQNAVIWHNKQKEQRLAIAKEEAMKTLLSINYKDKNIQELALSMLYLGEGGKTKSGTCMGSSDPRILRFFIDCLLDVYNVDINKIKCSLHLRADQDPELLKKFWSKELQIPIKNFTSVSIDLRTSGRPTYSTYNGVCVVNCGSIALQRKLVYLGKAFCDKIIGV